MAKRAQFPIQDLQNYIATFEFTISPTALATFSCAEEIGQASNCPLCLEVFLVACLEIIPALRSSVIRLGGNPASGIATIRDEIALYNDEYIPGQAPYSTIERGMDNRAIIVDLCLSIASRNRRTQIIDSDIVEALLEMHDQECPVSQNMTWSDEALNTNFNTLSHIIGKYYPQLWVKFEDLRRDLTIENSTTSSVSNTELAPPEIKTATLSILSDFPDTSRNAFLIMPFSSTPIHEQITEALKSTLKGKGFNLFRADDRIYSDDISLNIQAYMHACRFGIAIFERVIDDNYNPNVCLEVGYMMALRKPICLLKEKSLKELNADLLGKVYMEFDAHNINASIEYALNKWLQAKAIEP